MCCNIITTIHLIYFPIFFPFNLVREYIVVQINFWSGFATFLYYTCIQSMIAVFNRDFWLQLWMIHNLGGKKLIISIFKFISCSLLKLYLRGYIFFIQFIFDYFLVFYSVVLKQYYNGRSRLVSCVCGIFLYVRVCLRVYIFTILNFLLTSNIVPPVPVLIKRGFFSADFWINILLCLLGFLPGLLHSYYIILVYPYRAAYAALGGDGHNNRSDDYGATTSTWLLYCCGFVLQEKDLQGLSFIVGRGKVYTHYHISG